MTEIRSQNDLLRFIKAVQSIETLPEESMAEIAQYLLARAQDSANRGVDPYDNSPWLTKKDGGRALPDVAKDISVRHFRRSAELKLVGGAVYHNKGSTHHGIKRRVIPTTALGIPAGWAAGVVEILQRNFQKKVDL